jgi:hypothetical protein
MSGKRKFLALPPKERTCAGLLFCILAVALPGFYGSWHFFVSEVEPTASFALGFGLRLVIPVSAVGICGYMLWNRRSFVSASSVGVAFIYTSIWFGFVASCILITGRVPSKYHSYAVPRDRSIPVFVVASLALAIGAGTRAFGRTRSRQKPNNRWRGP